MGGIGAVSPLRRFAPALPEGEPRAWWVSTDGGRGKGAVGVDGRCVKFRFVGMLEVRKQLLPRPVGRGTSRREGERDVQTVRGGMQFPIRNRCSGSEDSLSVESVQ